jgi:HD-like signal output (HDOD) protein
LPEDRKRRILFVDDESLILEGLQRVLRAQRNEWEMVFANCGNQALAELEAGPFDVIVTDMRMPGQDGVALLEQVKERFPAVVRIVLSGFVEKDSALRAIPVAHQYLAKPCEPSKLREVIERCCSAGNYLEDDATRRVVGAVGELPSLPRHTAMLLDAIQDPNASIPQIAKLVEQDVGITAKVLQLVNSAFFGIPREISSVCQAVSYLGLHVLKSLLLSAEVYKMFRPSKQAPGFSFEGFQEHSHLTARIASRLPLPASMTSTAVVAAILHDSGMLVLSARRSHEFGQVLAVARKDKRPVWRVEEELLGTSHAEVGAYLLGVWGLPQPIVQAVAQHHRPSPEPPAQARLTIPAAVYIADVLALECQAASRCEFPTAHEGFDPAYLTGLGEEIEGWRGIAAELAQAPRSD